jgi:HD-GYP domain-containing protein (c-di-GMP phosphodiesterase class II)
LDQRPTAEEKKSEVLKEALPTFDHENAPAILGAEFVLRFQRLLKGAGIYDRNNALIDRLAQEFLQVVNPFIQSEGHLLLKIVVNNFFFNNVRIPVKADKFAIFKSFSTDLEKRSIGEIEFTAPVAADDLINLVYILSGLQEKDENNYLSVQSQLESQGIDGIKVGRSEVSRGEALYIDSEKQKKYSKEVYFRAIHLVKEVTHSIGSKRLINIRKAKHLMQNAVNSLMLDESTLLGLANIKNYDEYTFNHSVNVAIYAIALGQRIGLPKKILSHLGMAGLLHDIGKTKIPPEILNKTGNLSPQEWAVIRWHPITGTEIILRVKEWGDLSTRLITAAFEHHLRYDLSGYPRLSRKRSTTLFGRIVALADFFDALIRPRAYRGFPYVSEKILGFMLERAGKDFDPALVKIFINMIGVFPLGTLVLLNTNEMAIVVQIQEDPELIDRPKVCLLTYSNGEYLKGKVMDLKEVDETTGAYKRAIVKTLDPNEYNINVAEFLI